MEHIFVEELKRNQTKLAPYRFFLKTDASEDNHLNKETHQLLPLARAMASQQCCINTTVGLSDDDDKLLIYGATAA